MSAAKEREYKMLIAMGMQSGGSSYEPSKHDPEIELAHMFMDLYGWSWEDFWEKTPVCVINSLSELIKERLSKGILGPKEMIFFKCIARGKGSKAFDR